MGRVRKEEKGWGLVGYPSFPVRVEADEVVDGGDGVEEREVDAHEHQQPRHRARSVRHLALPPRPSSGRDHQTDGAARQGKAGGEQLEDRTRTRGGSGGGKRTVLAVGRAGHRRTAEREGRRADEF